MNQATNKDQIDLLKVAAAYTELEKPSSSTGEVYALCPLPKHHDTNPSCRFNPQKKMWYCHGCQEGGDVFDLLMKIHGCDFPEAIRLLREKHGIDYRSSSKNKNQDQKKPLYEAAEWAAQVMRSAFKGDPILFDNNQDQASKAQNYMDNRRFHLGDMNRWYIGLCPNYPTALADAAKLDKIDLEALVKIGLVRRNQDGSYKDLFSGRIVIPIRDRHGRICGFVGRRMKGKLRKYINSTDSSIFKKSEILMNLDMAWYDIRSTETAILVEGPLDLVRLVQLGINNVVSTMGTSLSDEQIDLLASCGAKKAILFGDGDEAGRIGSLKRGEKFLHRNFSVYVVDTPDNQDPDSLGRDYSTLTKSLLRIPLSFIQFLVKQADPIDHQERANTASYISSVLAHVPDITRRKFLASEAGKELGVEFEVPVERPAELRSLRVRKERKTEVKLPRICLDVIYVIIVHWCHPAVAEMVFNLMPSLLDGVFPETGKKTIQMVMDRMEACNGDFEEVEETTKFPEDIEAVIKRAISLNEGTNIDWNRFLISVSQWVSLEQAKNKLEELKKQLIQPDELHDPVLILDQYISTKRKELISGKDY
jgi:DNA primase catalytic core